MQYFTTIYFKPLLRNTPRRVMELGLLCYVCIEIVLFTLYIEVLKNSGIVSQFKVLRMSDIALETLLACTLSANAYNCLIFFHLQIINY